MLQFLSTFDVTVGRRICVVMCLGCLINDSFPFRECVENVINYFSWAGGSPYFKQSSVEFLAES